jgi:hypothetical protein
MELLNKRWFLSTENTVGVTTKAASMVAHFELPIVQSKWKEKLCPSRRSPASVDVSLDKVDKDSQLMRRWYRKVISYVCSKNMEAHFAKWLQEYYEGITKSNESHESEILDAKKVATKGRKKRNLKPSELASFSSKKPTKKGKKK